MSWQDFLKYLAEPSGIVAVLGFILSWLVEYIPGFDALVPKWKRLVVLVLSMAIPLVGVGLSIATGVVGDVTWELTWWPALVAGFLAFGGATVAQTRQLK